MFPFFVAIFSLLAIAYKCLQRKRLEIKDKICVVTGGSNGIGLELCKQLLPFNKVVNLDIVSTNSIQNKNYKFIECDVSNYEQVENAFSIIRNELGKVDILVNNAGVYTGKSLVDLKQEEILKTLGTNLHALFWVTQQTLPLMDKSNYECYIANMSSCLGLAGVANMTDYCASKFGVYGFSESLRQEFQIKSWKINVLTVCPYLVNTGMFKRVKIKFPTLMPGMETKVLVKQIIHSISKRRSELWTPWFVYFVPLTRLFPTCIYDLIQSFLGANEAL